MNGPKIGVLLVWLVSGACVLVGGDSVFVTIGRWVFWLTLVAHVVEFAVKQSLFKRVGGSLGHHFVQTMLYGLFHWKPLEEKLAAEGDSPTA